MDNIDETFIRFKNKPQTHHLSENFENIVFAKIKKKKKERRIIKSTLAGIVIFIFLFLAKNIILHEEIQGNKLARSNPNKITKEEVPVIEDVIFASSDRQTNYALEQVAYYEDNNTI